MGSSDGDLRGAQFDKVEMTGARFRVVDLSGARFDQVALSGVVMRGVELLNVDIDGAIEMAMSSQCAVVAEFALACCQDGPTGTGGRACSHWTAPTGRPERTKRAPNDGRIFKTEP